MTESLRRPAAALAATALAAALAFAVKKAPSAPEPRADEDLRDAVAALPPAGPAGTLLPGSSAAGRGMARPGATPGAASAGLSALYQGGKVPSLPEALRAALGASPLLPPPASLDGPASPFAGASGRLGLLDLEAAVPPARGAVAPGFQREDGRWWAWTRQDRGPFLWHEGRWWWKGEGTWFLLNARRLAREALFVAHCRSEAGADASGPARLVYSRDGGKAAVLIPGSGAWLFDAASGEKLGRWPLQAALPQDL